MVSFSYHGVIGAAERVERTSHVRWVVSGVFALLLCGCATTGGRTDLPEWVRDPAAIEQAFPRRSYFTGLGVCAGAGSADVMSRKQAEAMAVSDIASVVEVQINDTIEDHDTSVERNGRLLEQSVRIQMTKRVVTGILSGVEIKKVFFDERALNWYALAALNRVKAGAGAAEAVAQRITEGRATLAGLGQGPVQDFVALRGLDQMLTELDRLAVALAIFAPSRQAAARTEIDAFKQQVAARRQAAQAGARVRVTVQCATIDRLPDGLREAANNALRHAGFTVVDGEASAELRVRVELKTSTKVGAMRIFETDTFASFVLVEKGQRILEGTLPVGVVEKSRAGSEEVSRSRCLARLADPLQAALESVLNRGEE